MKRHRIALVVVGSILAAAATAGAQGTSSRFEVALFPNSHLMTTRGETDSQPGFRTYTPGGVLTFKINRYFGVEADVSGSRGSSQSPAMTAVAGDAVFSLAPSSLVRPYAVVGVGSMHMFRRTALGLAHGETFDSANVGGGVKIMFRHWGLRGDYRYLGMDSTSSDRSVFVGPGTRHAHRISAGIVIAPGRSVRP